MSWTVIVVLALGAYGFKAFGVLGLGRVGGSVTARFEPLTALIPAALFAGLIAVQTVADGDSLVLDARFLGVAAGTLAVWRRAPFVVVVMVAMAVTAFVRWQTWV
ncbi:MAG: AzlD domain-containing protein [Actinomycetota bacterium]